ncbi:uncharacterized protein LOC142532499 [Primulina tabacum]|uniref:uncharacterized protein LOC142532499 n=1 Tax=Primulina tabacum TaxID=48773 RepID=UPI003F592ECC
MHSIGAHIYDVATSRKLLTRNRLKYLDDKSCVLCNGAEESVHHLYFICPIARSIWNGIRDWLGLRKIMDSPTTVLNAFQGVYRGNSTLNMMRCAVLSATVYHVWNIKNGVMFDNAKPNVEEIIKAIKIHVFRCIPRSIDFFQPSTRSGLL